MLMLDLGAIHRPSSRSSEAVNTMIFSPSPCEVKRVLRLRIKLFSMTAFAAARMLPVER